MSAEVSVIMAVHNEPPEILRCALSSIFSQTLQGIELIICDDGSAPITAQALNSIVLGTDAIVVQNDVALGAGPARNRALHLAHGKYIAIMDADDISERTRLEKELIALKDNPGLAFVGSKGELFERIPGDRSDHYWFVRQPKPRDFLMTLPFVHASIMFRKSALNAVGGYRECNFVTRSEDYDLLLRLYEKGFRGENLSETLYFIRMDERTLQRRKYRYRFNEMIVKMEGFRRLGLMPVGIPYALKPLAVGLLPNQILNRAKGTFYRDKN